MINKIAARARHFTDMGWLKTFWLFSFSDYYDPQNVEHGMLRVFNDDVVEPHTGFSTHPHEEMEIISIILDGEMAHKDTMGNETIIRTNDVQRMTAGTGLYHSEQNVSDNPVHFYQIWIRPDKANLTPSYDQKSFKPDQWRNQLTLLASEGDEKSVVNLNTDAKLYRAELDENHSITYSTAPNRKVFIYVIAGVISINSERFEQNDQARISEVESMEILALTHADLLLIDVP
jgi:redox-sensitive bicupin YhaK (pirin superfamily)